MAWVQQPTIRLYRPLLHYLETLPAEQQHVQLTRADLEALLGPAHSAMPGHMPNWTLERILLAFRHRSGFVATLDRHAGVIIFTRQAAS